MVRVFGLTTGTLAIPLSATEGTVRLATGSAASAAVPAPVSPAATAHVAATAAMVPPRTGRRTRDRGLIQTLLHRRFVVPRGARPGLAGRSRRAPARVPPARSCCGPARSVRRGPHRKLTRGHSMLTPPLPVARACRYSQASASFGRGIAALIDYRLLGPIEAAIDGRVIDLGGQRQRALLALLLLSANEPVARDLLVDRLWGDGPPAGAQHTLDVYVSRLRKALEPAAGCQVVLTRPGAYVLQTEPERIDARRFERLAAEGRRALAAGEPHAAATALRAALALWRGAPFADVRQDQFAQPEAALLEELRATATEDRMEAELALGRHADVEIGRASCRERV